jgi:hypothetical protein
MQLELAIVQNCTSTGCVVQLLNDDLLNVNYSVLVQNRVPIRQQQLVAIDTEVTPPQIMWRWHRVRVQEVKPERIVAFLGNGTLVNLVRKEALEVQLAEGDEVWTIGLSEDQMEVHEHVRDGKPAHPVRLLSYIQPTIEAMGDPRLKCV